MISKLFRLAALFIAVCAAACTVSRTEAPPLTGPSELATSLTLTATPDTLLQDGASQSSIIVTAIGPNGRPLTNIAIRLSTAINDVPQDFGTLSARTVVTGSDGRAATVYTAPPAPSPLLGGAGTMVSVQATAIGFDATTSPAARIPSVDIRLVPPGVILPPADTPTAQFTFTPAAPSANSPVAFDASASCGGRADTNGCLPSNFTIVSYNWSFGDGAIGSGKTATHAYAAPGPYSVTLTVTNDRGIAASTIKQVSVGAGTPPTAAFVFSPATPAVLQDVSFNASISTAAPGHSIVSYAWDFGDGAKKSGVTTTHDYAVTGTFNVVLTVTDDAGQIGTAVRTVSVGATPPPPGTPPPTAAFVFSPTSPQVGGSVSFNATASTAASGHSIVSYSWNFGDGGVASGVLATHAFATAGTYNVVLAVTDDAGQTATATSGVSVGSGGGGGGSAPPTASFVFSPAAPGVNQDVFFNASSSAPAVGRTIVSYAWDFGDGAAGTGITANHAYGRGGTFTVTLVVRDDIGQSANTSRSVTVSSASGQIVAEFVFSPSDPLSLQIVFFDATPSIPSEGATITNYTWDFGDGSTCLASGAGCGGGTPQKPQHAFATKNTFVVRLTITDSAGRTATVTHNVTTK
jgi:PKD repeat protein